MRFLYKIPYRKEAKLQRIIPADIFSERKNKPQEQK